MGDGEAGIERLRGGRVRRSSRIDNPDESLGHASQPAILPRSVEVRPRAMDSAESRSPAQILLLSFWRRPEGLHRGRVRVDGGNIVNCGNRAEMEDAIRGWSSSRD